MEKVGAFTERATDTGEWRGGNPASGLQATPMLADYFNMLQRELLAVLADAGIAPDVLDDGQLAQAIQQAFTSRLADSVQAQDHLNDTLALTPASLIAGVLGSGSATTNSYAEFPYRDVTTGELKRLIVQWGIYFHDLGWSTVTFPIAYPNAALWVGMTDADQSASDIEYFGLNNTYGDNGLTPTDFQFTDNIAGGGRMRWLSIGH